MELWKLIIWDFISACKLLRELKSLGVSSGEIRALTEDLSLSFFR